MNRLLTSGVRTGFLRVASRPVAAHSYVKKTKAITARNFSSKGASPFYDATMSSNSRYILFILLGAAVGEAIFGFAGDMVWEINNRGVSIVNVISL
mmetsp:Transcript_10690/g.12217  ORF Transcript_10690/g.12217 Transcript_10690/m.12217 type:complete len:96 (-) Transcript_10690:251-538(-)